MKNAPRGRLFVPVCGIYALCVLAAFVLGLVAKDDSGIAFLPAALLTLPWFYVLPLIAERLGFHFAIDRVP